MNVVLVLIVALLILAVFFYTIPEQGCSGDCNQGRRPCNCPRSKNGIQ